MIFRRPLKAFQRYEIKTKLVFWDEKRWEMCQSFDFQGKRVLNVHSTNVSESKSGFSYLAFFYLGVI
ncbi:MAG: hypothetical protein EBZ49_06700 [Proteobacteria bacterium]|nr:hypothetical protein [Pseudomonadota bacterium]